MLPAFSDFEKYQKVRRSFFSTKDNRVTFPQKQGWPAGLVLAWPSKLSLDGVLKSAFGVDPIFERDPQVEQSGLLPGDGPSFTDVVTWADGGTLVVKFTATSASADLVGDVQVFGPLYAASTGLKAKDGVNVATCATSWGVGEVVTAVVQTEGAEMRISDGTTYSAWTNFDGTMPAMAFADTAPGKIKKFEEWKKVTPRPGMLLFDGDALTWNGDTIFWEGI